MSRVTLLYDSDCGFCRWSIDRILRWDRRRRIRALALQAPEADELLGPMDHDRKMASWHLVNENGTVYSAGAAAGPLLRHLPGGKPLAVLAETFPGPTAALYRLIARNREKFGRLLGEQACSVDPQKR